MLTKNHQEISREASEICKFYARKTIFITGAAGFLGSVLLETFLRCCPDISTIYILLRSKKGLTVDERKNAIFKKDIFIKLRTTNPDVLEKVTAVSGDTSQHHLGLNENVYNKLTKDVSIVFHVAATVSFTKPLGRKICNKSERFVRQAGNEKTTHKKRSLQRSTKHARNTNHPQYIIEITVFVVNQNVVATSNILEFCRKLENLEAFVYTSSVYSNSNQKGIIEEKIYDLPFSSEEIIKLARDNNEHEMMRLYGMCNPPFPNFYTFSKCVAENLLKEKAYDLPVCIIRPSIIISCLKGALPGYVEENSAMGNLCVGSGRGFIRVLGLDKDKRVEIIPADVTANAHIVAAFNQASKSLPSPSVYNCVTGELAAHTWGSYVENLLEMSKSRPLPHSYLYPTLICCKNPVLYTFFSLLLHYIPAVIADMLLWISGSSFRLVKLYKFYDKAMKAVHFFTMNEWDMKNKNFQALSKELNAIEEEMFCMDLKDFTFETIIRNLWTGSSIYLRNGKPYEEKFKWKCLRYFLTFSLICFFLGSASSILYLIFKTMM